MKKLFFLFWSLISLSAFGQTEYHTTSADQTKLYVEELGNGEPVILLSGGPGFNPGYLKPVWQKLSSNFRSIILHQRGAGKFIISTVDSTSMSMENYVNDLEELRKHLKLEKVTLIGHSWGGMLAMEYVANHPEKVEKLILLGSGGPTANFGSYYFDNINMRLLPEDWNERAVLDSLNKSTLGAIWPGYFFDRKMALKSKSNTDFEAMNGQLGVAKFTVPNYFSNGSQRVNLIKRYKGIVHIIQGRQDPIGESTVYEIKDILPQSQINFIEKCGHLPWLENEQQRIEFYDLLYSTLQ